MTSPGNPEQDFFKICQEQNTPATVIEGNKGSIRVARPTPSPREFTVQIYGGESRTEKFPIPEGMSGLGYEADEVGRLLRDGRIESEDMTWQETIEVMKVCDEIRRQNDVVFPDAIEKC